MRQRHWGIRELACMPFLLLAWLPMLMIAWISPSFFYNMICDVKEGIDRRGWRKP